jgi:hypothetical protein
MKSYSDDILTKEDINPAIAALELRLATNEEALARSQRNLITITVINLLIAVTAIIFTFIH